MPLSLKPHIYKRQPNTDRAILVGLNPYCRLSKEGEFPVFIQGGGFYDASGNVVDPVPDWVQEELNKMTPEARKEVGLAEPSIPKARPKSKPEPEDEDD